jgi:hypothetical protein
MRRRLSWIFLFTGAFVAAAVLIHAAPLVAVGIGVAAGVSLSGSI